MEGVDHGKIDIVDSPDGNIAHGGETGETGAAKKVNQKRLDQVVGVMCEKDCVTASLFRDFCKERIARLTRGSFDRHLLFSRDRADIRRSDFKIDIVFRREFFDKARVGIARASAQLVIQVADDQLLVTNVDKVMKERDGIASAGNADEMARVRREPAKQGCLNLNPIHPVVASNVRRLTMNDDRYLDKMRSRRRLHHKRRVAYYEQRT